MLVAVLVCCLLADFVTAVTLVLLLLLIARLNEATHRD